MTKIKENYEKMLVKAREIANHEVFIDVRDLNHYVAVIKYMVEYVGASRSSWVFTNIPFKVDTSKTSILIFDKDVEDVETFTNTLTNLGV